MATIAVKRDGETYTVRYIRRRRKSNIVVAAQGGFATAEEAQAWGEQAQKNDLAERRQRRSADAGHQAAVARKRQRKERERQRANREKALHRMPLRELAGLQGQPGVRAVFEERVETLWGEIVLRALKRGESEARAYKIADNVVGSSWRVRREKAIAGALDEVADFADTEAIANAKRISLMATGKGG